jgi:hypothetical protein
MCTTPAWITQLASCLVGQCSVDDAVGNIIFVSLSLSIDPLIDHSFCRRVRCNVFQGGLSTILCPTYDELSKRPTGDPHLDNGPGELYTGNNHNQHDES